MRAPSPPSPPLAVHIAVMYETLNVCGCHVGVMCLDVGVVCFNMHVCVCVCAFGFSYAVLRSIFCLGDWVGGWRGIRLFMS